MRLLTHLGFPAVACLVAAGCGGSPTAPSATDPAVSAFTSPYPEPVSQTLTGTWFLGEQRFMTLTQNGASVTGMPSPAVFDANGVTVTESGLISGVVEGDRVTLSVTDRITLSGAGPEVICTAAHAFTGVLAGNTLSGTLTAAISPLTCSDGAGIPDIELPTSGPTIYTRQ
jgi:hypothetical protein